MVEEQEKKAEERSKEMEIVIAELETRLRATILRIIRPTLEQVNELGARLDTMSEDIVATHGAIALVDTLRLEVQQVKQQAGANADLIMSRFTQVDDTTAKIQNQELDLRSRTSDLEVKIEGMDASIRQLAREHPRIYEELRRIDNHHEDSITKVWAGLETNFSHNEQRDNTTMDHVFQLQKQREALMEDLFGEGKVIDTIRRHHSDLVDFCSPLPDMEKEMRRLRADVDVQAAKTKECISAGVDLKNEFKDLGHNVRHDLDKFQDEFKVKINHLTAYNAALMTDIRNDYSDELGAMRRLRSEITTFEVHTRSFCKEIQERVEADAARVDSLHRELRQDIDELTKKQKKDRVAVDSELRDLRRDEATHRELHQTARMNVEYLGRIVGLVLESGRVSNALAIQDYVDRCGEKWLGLPADLGRHAQDSLAAADLLKQRTDPDGSSATALTKPQTLAKALIPLDWRQGLAQDGYRPGQVAFRGTLYERQDLLALHYKLLQKAFKAYSEAPTVDSKDVASKAGFPDAAVTRQPGANGGFMAGQEAKPVSSAKGDFYGSAGARQMQGSLGQPQAVGSRGHGMGDLGRTEPPEEDIYTGQAKLPLLKLPGIAGATERTKMGSKSVLAKPLTAR